MNKYSSGIFETTDYFMLRTPLLSISKDYENINVDDLVKRLKNYTKEPYIQEAIAISSPTLFNSLEKLDGDPSSKKTRNTISSLLKFLIRMSSRPTPFGLFAGITTGEFTNKASSGFLSSIKHHKKRTRPDMEWLLGVIAKVEMDESISKHLRVIKNSATFSTDERIHLSYYSNFGQIRKSKEKKKR
ncbi:lantibiotic dehydratase [Geomicrobium sp. JCM 19055]|uniref:lantibiotic dehydratase n=1 Tax=Geomicrobium sp. JCM 19055 TaxID=1460649 RepID=UPI0005A70078|nr:lantibiotic dehydratase [Geomicrobium sp. JCM 19055]